MLGSVLITLFRVLTSQQVMAVGAHGKEHTMTTCVCMCRHCWKEFGGWIWACWLVLYQPINMVLSAMFWCWHFKHVCCAEQRLLRLPVRHHLEAFKFFSGLWNIPNMHQN